MAGAPADAALRNQMAKKIALREAGKPKTCSNPGGTLRKFFDFDNPHQTGARSTCLASVCHEAQLRVCLWAIFQ